jgi:hypothetical protein
MENHCDVVTNRSLQAAAAFENGDCGGLQGHPPGLDLAALEGIMGWHVWKPMIESGRTLARILVAAALAVAGLMLAPADAMAHVGHVHGAAAISHTVNGAPEAVQSEAASQHLLEVVQAPAKDTGGDRACTCCFCTAPCGGCCAAWVVLPPNLRPPPIARATPMPTADRATGLLPEALPEPPKAIV